MLRRSGMFAKAYTADWLAQNKTYLPHIEEPVSQNLLSGIQRQKRGAEKAVCKGVFKVGTWSLKRCEDLIEHPQVAVGADFKINILMMELGRCCGFLKKFTDQMERHLNKEKKNNGSRKDIFIFEEHTCWSTMD
jgi:hypothetical protein